MSCAPQGMMEILDTSHVVIQGLGLRTWDVAYLDANGQPGPSPTMDTLQIIERIGALPRRPYQGVCPGFPGDYDWVSLLCYTDIDIAITDGTPCDLPTILPATLTNIPSPRLLSEPSSAQIRITGLTSAALIRLRDALGREVMNSRSVGPETVIATDGLASGPYFIEIIPPNGMHQVLRWVKE